MKIKTIAMTAIFICLIYILLPYIFIKINAYFSLLVFSFIGLRVVGLISIIAGFIIWLYSGKLFKVIGKGTPAPINPPKKLVVTNLYKYTRNPMYVGMFLILLGYFLFLGYLMLLIYLLLMTALFNLLVIKYEEPTLRKKFGKDYLEYCKKTPRWF